MLIGTSFKRFLKIFGKEIMKLAYSSRFGDFQLQIKLILLFNSTSFQEYNVLLVFASGSIATCTINRAVDLLRFSNHITRTIEVYSLGPC